MIQLITGNITADSGYIHIDEQEVSIPDPLIIKNLGVYNVQAVSKLMPYLSIAENLCVIDHPPTHSRIVNHKLNRKKTEILLKEFGLSYIKPTEPVSNLSTPMCYILDILRCVILDAKVLVIGDIFFKPSPKDLVLMIRIL